jgi:hypothetical protein
MSSVLYHQIIPVRFLVGFLGEQGQANWWPSRFLSPTSERFLQPVFAKTTLVAQYHGVRDAASAVHDSHLGLGRVFHLFRLPEAVEQRLFAHLLDVGIPEDIGQALTSRDAAMARLRGFFKSAVELHGGPLMVGTTEDLHGYAWLSRVAAVYHAAFEGADAPAFPYLVEGL